VAETVLGFDFGRRRIGVAVGETLTGSARPLKTVQVRHGTPPWSELELLVSDWRPARLVIGIPLHFDGGESATAAAAREFAAELERRTGKPVTLWNEALSTEEARMNLDERRNGKTRPGDRDLLNAEAARTILAGWLDENRNA
jgi:putative pre-16S rRNA nuclease